MVKRGSPHLRYVLMNVAITAKNYNAVLAEYYNKKRAIEGKINKKEATRREICVDF